MAMYVREVPCDICDTVEDVNNFCLNCKQRFCDNCKKGHLRTAFTKHHKFVPIGDSLLASSEQGALCPEHKEENQFYCKTCPKTCCSVCLSEYHKSHDFTLISRLIDEVRNEMEEKLSMKEKDVSQIENLLKSYVSASENCSKQSEEIISYIKKTIHGWVTDLKSLEDELIEETKSAAEKEKQIIDQKTRELQSTRETHRKEIQDVRLLLRTSSDASLLEQKKSISAKVDSIVVPTKGVSDPVLPNVKLRQSTREDVRRIVRNLQPDMRETSANDTVTEAKQGGQERRVIVQKPKLRDETIVTNRLTFEEWVYDIAPVSKSKAWIGTDDYVMLVNTDGEILLKRLHGNTGVIGGTSVTSTSSGDALYVSNYTVINRIDQTGKVIKFVDLTPKNINCVRLSKLNDMIFVATDNDILKLSLDGKVKGSINCCALALTELTDGRLIAINTDRNFVLLTNDDNVTLLNNSIEWRWSRFMTALTSDSCDRIVVGHPGGKQLHVYELRGEKLELLKEYTVDMKHIGIIGVTVDGQGRLWIGTWSDGLLIAEYCE